MSGGAFGGGFGGGMKQKAMKAPKKAKAPMKIAKHTWGMSGPPPAQGKIGCCLIFDK